MGPGSGKEGGEVGRGGNKKLKYEKKTKEKMLYLLILKRYMMLLMNI